MLSEFSFTQALYIQALLIVAFFYIQTHFYQKYRIKFLCSNAKITSLSGRVAGVWLFLVIAIHDSSSPIWVDILLLAPPLFILILPLIVKDKDKGKG